MKTFANPAFLAAEIDFDVATVFVLIMFDKDLLRSEIGKHFSWNIKTEKAECLHQWNIVLRNSSHYSYF